MKITNYGWSTRYGARALERELPICDLRCQTGLVRSSWSGALGAVLLTASPVGLNGMGMLDGEVDLDPELRHLRALRHAGGITVGANPVGRLRHQVAGGQGKLLVASRGGG